MIPHDNAPARDELPDISVTREQRHHLKALAEMLADLHNVHQLMFLAGAIEDQARKKRGKAS